MNDIEKAIEYLKEPIGKSLIEHNEAINLAISALEKQISKIPHAEDNGGYPEYIEHWLECPECGEAIPEYTANNETECYCVGCGQFLKWEVEE